MGIVCRLEDDLISPEKWESLFDKMPKECQEATKEGGCIGIGRNEKLGWFIMISGQGPCLVWQEKGRRN